MDWMVLKAQIAEEKGGMRERGLVSPFPRRRFPASAITPFTASRRPLLHGVQIFSFSPNPPIARRPGRQTAKAIAICCRNGEGVRRKEERGGARVWKRKLFRLYCRRLGKGGGENGAVLIGRKKQKEKGGRKDGEIQEQDSPKSSMVSLIAKH